MKYNLKKIMKRAWEIKELVDQKTKNSLLNRNIFRELKKEEKALFSECLKEAWKEAKRASELEKELKIKKEQSERLAKKETQLSLQECEDVSVAWNIWHGTKVSRAYFKVASWSNYANSKRYNYVELA